MKKKEKTITAEEFFTQINDIWNTAKEKIEDIADNFIKKYLHDNGYSKQFADCFELEMCDEFGYYDFIHDSEYYILFFGHDINLRLNSLLQMADKNKFLDHIEKETDGFLRKEEIEILKLERKN